MTSLSCAKITFSILNGLKVSKISMISPEVILNDTQVSSYPYPIIRFNFEFPTTLENYKLASFKKFLN